MRNRWKKRRDSDGDMRKSVEQTWEQKIIHQYDVHIYGKYKSMGNIRTSIWEIHGKYMGICVKDDVYCARIYGEIYGNMGNLWGYIWEIHGKHVGSHM